MVVKLMSTRIETQSASAYEINGAISEIAKSGLVLMGFHLDSRSRYNLDGLRGSGKLQAPVGIDVNQK